MRKFNLKQRKVLHLPEQRSDEKIILMLRRHWTIMGHHLIRLAAFMIIPVVVFGFLYSLGWTIEIGGATYITAIMGLSLYYIFIWLFYFHEFVDYHLDVWVVTDQRIISMEQIGLFNRTVSEHSIIKVQDVSAEIKGKVQTFLDYGHVHVQTAGASQRFVFSEVGKPREVARVIMKVHERAVEKAGIKEQQTVTQNVLNSTQQQTQPQHAEYQDPNVKQL